MYRRRHRLLRPDLKSEVALVREGVSIPVVAERENRPIARTHLTFQDRTGRHLARVIRHGRQPGTLVLVRSLLVDEYDVGSVVLTLALSAPIVSSGRR